MKIYTSYFAALRHFPDDLVPIAICGSVPQFFAGLRYKKLSPKIDFFKEWKKNGDNNYYIEHFNSEVLNRLNPLQVVKELEELGGGKDIALICYEKPTDFCHRHLVAEWLNNNSIECKEFEWKRK